MAAPSRNDIANFIAVTRAGQEEATHFLQGGASLEAAVQDYFAAQVGEQDDGDVMPGSYGSPGAGAGAAARPAAGAGGRGGTAYTLSGEVVGEGLPSGWGQAAPSRFGSVHGGGGREEGQGRAGGAGGTGGASEMLDVLSKLKAKRREEERQRSGLGVADDDDDDEEGEGSEPEEFFTGGGVNSGLAVENPNSNRGGNPVVDRIMRAAAANTPDPGRSARGGGGGGGGGWFTGGGNVLGNDEPSGETEVAPPPRVQRVSSLGPSAFDQVLGSMFGQSFPRAPGPAGSTAPADPAGPDLSHIDPSRISHSPTTNEPIVHRTLTFWQNGFTIESGPLLSYADPANQALLRALEEGRAPTSAFGVPFDARVEVQVKENRSRVYEAPVRALKPFDGGGNRLGSVVPSAGGSGSAGASAGSAGSGQATPVSTGGTETYTFKVDNDQPTTSIQIRFADGSKQVIKFNLTHTISDLYAYVRSAHPGQGGGTFVLQTTFPAKELKEADGGVSVDSAGLRNSVVVQRFV